MGVDLCYSDAEIPELKGKLVAVPLRPMLPIAVNELMRRFALIVTIRTVGRPVEFPNVQGEPR